MSSTNQTTPIASGNSEPKSPNRRNTPRVKIGQAVHPDQVSRRHTSQPGSTTNSDSDSAPRTPVTPDSDTSCSDRGNKTPITPGTPSAYISFMFDPPDLTEPDDFSDVTLVVEGKSLYTCRGMYDSYIVTYHTESYRPSN